MKHDYEPSGVCRNCKASSMDVLMTQLHDCPGTPGNFTALKPALTRTDVYSLIDAERDSQDKNWPRDLGVNPQRAQYQFNAPHILLLEEKLSRIRGMWYGAETEKLRAEFVKIAAIAVRALEEVQ